MTLPLLAIGDRSYSSWSLRGWLLFDAFGLPVETVSARLYTDELAALTSARFAPGRTAPACRFPDGALAWDSLAIAEELATRHPGAGHWPADPVARAFARSLAAEMHSGFQRLRSECPMNLRVAYVAPPVRDAVAGDLARLEAIWGAAWDAFGGDWLCGAYSTADAFYAPVAMRIAAYDLPVSARAQAYVDAHLSHPSLRRWRAEGLAEGPDQEFYRRPWPTKAWPG